MNGKNLFVADLSLQMEKKGKRSGFFGTFSMSRMLKSFRHFPQMWKCGNSDAFSSSIENFQKECVINFLHLSVFLPNIYWNNYRFFCSFIRIVKNWKLRKSIYNLAKKSQKQGGEKINGESVNGRSYQINK